MTKIYSSSRGFCKILAMFRVGVPQRVGRLNHITVWRSANDPCRRNLAVKGQDEGSHLNHYIEVHFLTFLEDISPFRGFQNQSGSLVCVLSRLRTMDSSDSPLVRHLPTS